MAGGVRSRHLPGHCADTGSPGHAEENVAATAIELSRDEIEAIKGG